MEMNYYLGTITYNAGKKQHQNHILVKAKNKYEASRSIHDNAIDKGLSEEKIISIEIHNTIGQEELS